MSDSYKQYIITSSKAVSGWMHARDFILTLFLWGFYIYLLRDFFTFIRHVIDWGWNNLDNMIGFCGPNCVGTVIIPPNVEIMHTLLGYAEIVGLLGAILIGWAIYNQLMYRNKNRRKTPHSVSAKDLAVMYHATPTDVESWQQARVLVMHHDQEGRLIKVDFKTDLAK